MKTDSFPDPLPRHGLDALLAGIFIDRDKRPYWIENVRTPLVVSLMWNAFRGGARNNASGAKAWKVYEAMRAELERRGASIGSPRTQARNFGGTCFCGNVGLYVVGDKTYCKTHHARAVLLRRFECTRHEINGHRKTVEKRAHKIFADNRDLARQSGLGRVKHGVVGKRR